MFENYENAYELDCRELHGWEMEQWDLMMEEDEMDPAEEDELSLAEEEEMDRAQEAAYQYWQDLVADLWGE